MRYLSCTTRWQEHPHEQHFKIQRNDIFRLIMDPPTLLLILFAAFAIHNKTEL